MPIRVMWFDQAKTTICLLYDGEWTWDEYYAAHDEVYLMADSVQQKVYLYHVTHDTPIPSGALPHMKRVAMQAASRVRYTIIISDDLFTRAMFQMFSKFAAEWADHHTIVPSLDAARRLRLQHNRSRVSR